MEKEQYLKDGILNAIKILDDEVQSLRAKRDSSTTDGAREQYTSVMLSHITSIIHLRDYINDEEESE